MENPSAVHRTGFGTEGRRASRQIGTFAAKNPRERLRAGVKWLVLVVVLVLVLEFPRAFSRRRTRTRTRRTCRFPLANAPSTLNPQLIFTSCPFSSPSPLRASRIACYPLRICCACNSSPRISNPGPHRCTSVSSFALAGILCGSDRPAAG